VTAIGIALLAGGVGLGLWICLAGLTGRQVLPRRAQRTGPGRLPSLSKSTTGAVGAAVLTLLATGWPVGALLAAGAVLAAPKLIGGKTARAEAVQRTEAIATWTEMVRDSIAAASGLEEAINATAAVAPAPIRPEVRRLVARLERQSVTSALAAFGADLAHPSGDLVVAALSIAARTEASDLTGLLSRLADAIRGEARMRIRVDVGRTQVRTASKVIIGVVAATIALLAVLNRDYLAVYADPAGQVVLLFVGGIFALGGWLLVRMAELEMPERFSARTSTEADR
jgi:hypothetical protein